MSLQTTLAGSDARLVDGLQSGFPVTERPYRAIERVLEVSEREVLSRVKRLHERGLFRRVGPVLNPPVIGSSALVGLDVPDERFDEVAALVNGYDAVNHNYQRDHRWNMWFVVTAANRPRRETILDEIATHTGCDLLRLPMETEYYINLEFPVVNEDAIARAGWETRTAVEPTTIPEHGADLSPLERRLILELQEGFPLTRAPYRDIAKRLDEPVADILDTIKRLKAENRIKRIGCIVNHHAVGFDENCMVVWDVPDDDLDERAVAAGRHPSVTYCCHRPRCEDDGWPYNLFTMIHGRNRSAVETTVDDLANTHLRCDNARLHTVEVLKQTGVRYRDLLSGADRQ